MIKFWNEVLPSVLDEATSHVDKHDMHECLSITEYIPEICRHMLSTEESSLSSAYFMINERVVTKEMRLNAVDWVIKVHYNYDL